MFGFISRKRTESKIDELIDMLDERMMLLLEETKTTTDLEQEELCEILYMLEGSRYYLQLLKSKI